MEEDSESKLPQLMSILNFIFEGSDDLITLLNTDFEYIWINSENYNRKLGYDKDDLIGKSLLEFMHPDDKLTPKQLKQIFDKNKKLDTRVRLKDGTYKWFEVRGYYFKSKDSTYKMFLISHDISDKKEIEVRYHQLFEHNPFIVIILDENGIIIAINRKLEDYGYQREEIIGKSFRELIDIIPKEYSSLLNMKFVELFKKLEIEPIDIQFIDSEKNLIWNTIYAHTVKIENKIFFQIILQDINDRKLAEQKLIESKMR